MSVKRVMNIAHRGASRYAPQNTMAAFKKAIEIGVDAIELDVHFSKDRRIVVIHDDTVDRTTDGTGAVNEFTLAELKKLDAGSYFSEEFIGQRIPTIEEVFEGVAGRTGLCIEIKEEGVAEALVPVIEEYDGVGGTTVTSGSFESIKKVRALNPKIKLGFLTREIHDAVVNDLLAIGVEQICPWQGVLDAEVVKSLHGKGLEVRAYGIGSNPELMEKMVKAGVDGMTVNDPARLKEIIERYAQ